MGTDWNLALKERSELIERSTPVVCSTGDRPSASGLWLSFFAHLAFLVWIIAARPAPHARFVHVSYQSAQMIRAGTHLSVPHKSTPARVRLFRAPRRSRQVKANEEIATQGSEHGMGLQEQAVRETAAMMMSFKIRGIYGFAPGPQYQLAIHTSGEMPAISAAQVPPHFQQYVVVEITIDIEGRVAEAHIVSGMVAPSIEQILLSGVHEFKYTPATRDGSPIPSQLDIVIRVPS